MKVGKIEEYEAIIDLSQITQEVSDVKRKKGGSLRERSLEDKHLISHLQASSASEHLQIDYALVLAIEYASGNKSSSVMRIPITILPVVSPEVESM